MSKGQRRRQYSVLQGLVRDLERALEESGTEEWKLLSTFDNLLFAIEEADVEATADAESHGSADVEDAAGDDASEAPPGGDACGPLFEGTGAGESTVGPDVPRGTLQRNSQPVPLVDTVHLTDDELMRIARARGLVAGGKEVRRGSTKVIA